MGFFVFALLAVAAISVVLAGKPLGYRGNGHLRPRDDGNEDDETMCKPNEVFKIYCNTCCCSPDGKSMTCTANFCSDDIPGFSIVKLSEDTELKNCKPSTNFRLGCDVCVCRSNGVSANCYSFYCDATTCESGQSEPKQLASRSGGKGNPSNPSGNQTTCIAKYCRDPFDS